ncbi:MAG: polysaccharide deacetylase [Firmicutes bacterium]|nr:polysaccharide deacetylase [Bacillota bacterium]
MTNSSNTIARVCRIITILLFAAFLIPLVWFPLVFSGTSSTPPITTPTLLGEKTALHVAPPPAGVYYLNDTPDFPLQGNAVYDIWTVEDRQNLGLPLALPPFTPYYGEKTVYLTFDDGPTADHTAEILAILQSEKIKATFFVVGTQIEKNPDVLRQIFQAGHSIGNHSYNHVYKDLYRSTSTFMDQLHHTDKIIKSIIGVRPRICRAPGGTSGSFTKDYWNSLTTQGYIETGWNIDAGDASRANAEKITANVIHQLTKNHFLWNHTIILLHDGRANAETVKALPNIIHYLKDQGFEFRIINPETPPAW